jgi:glutaredoxin-like protein NrdH
MEMAKPVKIYTISTCSHCKATKRLLDACKVEYEFTDVDLLEGDERKAILEDVRRLNPRCSFPTIIIGDKVIVGYQEDKIREALGL